MRTELIKWLTLALFLLLTGGVALYVYRPVESRLTRITVIGDSTAKIAPDTAVITFSVVTQGSHAINAQQENARKSESVKAAVEALGTDLKIEVKTSDYSLRPTYTYDSSPPKIKGYEVRNTVTVSLGNMDKVGNIVDAATAAGANSVEGIQFMVGEASPAQGAALALAAKQAMAKAEAMAASLNGRIVRIVQSTEGGVDPVHVQASYMSNTNTASARVAKYTDFETPIRAGALDLSSHVILVVDIAIDP
jgi:uncharacterized protein